jgi:hypothetical protein
MTKHDASERFRMSIRYKNGTFYDQNSALNSWAAPTASSTTRSTAAPTPSSLVRVQLVQAAIEPVVIDLVPGHTQQILQRGARVPVTDLIGVIKFAGLGS